MKRVLRCLGVCAFLAIPFVLWLGREVHAPCMGPCDPHAIHPGWVGPTIVVLILVGPGLLLASTLLGLEEP